MIDSVNFCLVLSYEIVTLSATAFDYVTHYQNVFETETIYKESRMFSHIETNNYAIICPIICPIIISKSFL